MLFAKIGHEVVFGLCGSDHEDFVNTGEGFGNLVEKRIIRDFVVRLRMLAVITVARVIGRVHDSMLLSVSVNCQTDAF